MVAHYNGNLMEELGQISPLPVIDTALFVKEKGNRIHPRDFLVREGWVEGGRYPKQTEFLSPFVSP